MKTLLIATTALALACSAAPGSAQLLGGRGGLGGSLGGSLGGLAGSGASSLGGTLNGTSTAMRSTTQGTLDTTASTKGATKVDRHKGSVSTSRSVSGTLDGTVANATGPVRGSASGGTGGAAAASGGAQLMGTDAVRDMTQGAVGSTRATVGAVRDHAGNIVGTVRDRAGNVASAAGDRAARLTQGSGPAASGPADGQAGGEAGGAGDLSLAGSGNATGSSGFSVTRGMKVRDATGNVIGRVHSVSTDAQGRIEAISMQVGDKLATLPATNFSGTGTVLVSAMGQGEVHRAAH